MPDNPFLRISLERLRDRFSQVADSYIGVRCFLFWENFGAGVTPVHDAMHQHFQTSSLNEIIGHQAQGISSTFGGQISYDDTVFGGWFVHERLYQARSGPYRFEEVNKEHRRAQECQDLFGELSIEGARLLLELTPSSHPAIESMINQERIGESSMLWLYALFQTGLKSPLKLGLPISAILPRVVEVDVLEATACRDLLEHVIYMLDVNPFAGSSTLISSLLQELDLNEPKQYEGAVGSSTSPTNNRADSSKPKSETQVGAGDPTTNDKDAASQQPKYDVDTGVLSYKNFNPRRYAGQAKNCRLVLTAFQEVDWAAKVHDPCPGGPDPSRVKSTVESLNRDLEGMKFSAADGGTSYLWAPSLGTR